MIALIFISILCWTLVSLIFFKMGYQGTYSDHLDEPRTKTNWNAIALFLNVRDGDFEIPKRKSGIDKEIAEEEKEIAELERHKEKIDTLANLKRRKERLFSDVHGTESWECKWCGSDDCLKPAYTVDGIAQYYCTSCHRWLNDGSSMV